MIIMQFIALRDFFLKLLFFEGKQSNCTVSNAFQGKKIRSIQMLIVIVLTDWVRQINRKQRHLKLRWWDIFFSAYVNSNSKLLETVVATDEDYDDDVFVFNWPVKLRCEGKWIGYFSFTVFDGYSFYWNKHCLLLYLKRKTIEWLTWR